MLRPRRTTFALLGVILSSTTTPVQAGIAEMVACLIGSKDREPLKFEKTVTEAQVRALSDRNEALLEDMGVQFDESHYDSTYLEDSARWGHQTVTGSEYATPFYGKILPIDGYPAPVAKGDANTPALKHPDLQRLLNALPHRPELVVDTTMSLSGVGGYYDPSRNVIALAPDSNWRTFVHEYQHAQFEQYIRSKINQTDLVTEIRSGADLAEILPPDMVATLGKAKIKYLQKLIKKELPENSINEALSAQDELNLLGFKRYIPSIGVREKAYALRHQVNDLTELQSKRPLTPAESKALATAKISLTALKDTMDKTPKAVATGLTLGLMLMPLGVELAAYQFLRNSEEKQKAMEAMGATYQAVYYNEKGQMLGVRQDGSIVYLKLNLQKATKPY